MTNIHMIANQALLCLRINYSNTYPLLLSLLQNMYSCRAELDEEINKLEGAIQRAKSEYVDVEVLNAGANAAKLLPILQSLCYEPKFRTVQDLQQEIEKLNVTVTNMMDEFQERIPLVRRINNLKSLVALNEEKAKNMDAFSPAITATNGTNMDAGVPAITVSNDTNMDADVPANTATNGMNMDAGTATIPATNDKNMDADVPANTAPNGMNMDVGTATIPATNEKHMNAGELTITVTFDKSIDAGMAALLIWTWIVMHRFSLAVAVYIFLGIMWVCVNKHPSASERDSYSVNERLVANPVTVSYGAA